MVFIKAAILALQKGCSNLALSWSKIFLRSMSFMKYLKVNKSSLHEIWEKACLKYVYVDMDSGLVFVECGRVFLIRENLRQEIFCLFCGFLKSLEGLCEFSRSVSRSARLV